MNLKYYIALMATSSILGWITLACIVLGTNPQDAGLGIFFLFYSSLFVAMACALSVISLVIRTHILKQDALVSRQVAKSFRQAMLLSILLVGLLFMQSRGLLSWWLALLFVITLSAVEFFLISYKPREFK